MITRIINYRNGSAPHRFTTSTFCYVETTGNPWIFPCSQTGACTPKIRPATPFIPGRSRIQKRTSDEQS
jgi:hypothetical protein